MSQMSNYLENALGNHILRNVPLTSPTTVYMALYTTDPTDADAGTEVSGSGYARQAVTFGAPSNGVFVNSAQVDFPVASGNWGTVTHVGIRDASSGGNLLFYGPMAVSRLVNSGDQLIFQTGQVSASLA